MKKFLLPLFSVSLLLPLGYVTFNSGVSYERANALVESDKYIYVDLSNNSKYLEAGAEPYLVFQTNNEYTLTEIDATKHIFKSDAEIGKDVLSNGFTVECFDGAYKSGLVTFSNDYYNIVTIGNDYSVLGYGHYGNRIDNPGATYRTQRVWLYSESSHDYGVRYVSEDLIKEAEMIDITNAFDGRKYYYADIPYLVDKVTFIEMSNYVTYKETKIESLAYGVCYSLSNDGYSYIRVPDSDAIMLSKVVEAYLTYGRGDSNGCTLPTVKSLFNTWFVSKSASKDDLNIISILDYSGYNKETGSYEGYEKSTPYTVSMKWNAMCSMAGIDPDTGLEGNKFLEWIKANKKLVIVIGILALGTVAGVVFIIILKKKKAKQ